MSETIDNALDRVPSGIAGLDTILTDGFLKGGLYMVQGLPGTGKTTLANQISSIISPPADERSTQRFLPSITPA